jgi:hypothetical protein
MAAKATKTDPALWEKVKERVTAGDKGGHSGQWSARKAQLAVREYKQAGGGYVGGKTQDNHLREWTAEDWGTGSGAPSAKTGERYLPKATRESLTGAEYAKTTAKKRRDTAAGKQHSKQPAEVAAKTSALRSSAAKPAPAKRTAAAAPKSRKPASRSAPPR